MTNEELRYQIDWNHISLREIQKAVDEAWETLAEPGSAIRQTAQQHGIDTASLPATRKEALALKKSEAGLHQEVVDLLLVATSHAARDVWHHVLLPWLRSRFGDDAIKERKTAAKAAKKKASGKVRD
jgi:hypothetical protein